MNAPDSEIQKMTYAMLESVIEFCQNRQARLYDMEPGEFWDLVKTLTLAQGTILLHEIIYMGDGVDKKETARPILEGFVKSIEERGKRYEEAFFLDDIYSILDNGGKK